MELWSYGATKSYGAAKLWSYRVADSGQANASFRQANILDKPTWETAKLWSYGAIESRGAVEL